MRGSLTATVTLILHIIQEHYGNIVHDVAKAILNIEDCTLLSLCRHFSSNKLSRLTTNEVRESLVVLVHHGLLNVQINPLQDDETEVTSNERLNQTGLIYSLNEDAILNRLQFPIVTKIAFDLFGELGSLIMDEIIVHSRLRYSDIHREIAFKFNSHSHSSNKNIEETFQQLILRRLIVPVPELDVFRRAKLKENKAAAILTSISEQRNSLNTSSSLSGPAKHNTKRKRQPLPNDSDFDMPPELRMVLEAEERAKKSIKNQDEVEMKFDEDITPSIPKVATSIPSTSRGRGRGRGRGIGGRVKESISQSSTFEIPIASVISTREPSFSTEDTIPVIPVTTGHTMMKDNIMWSIGWEQVIRERRHALCITIARSRLGNVAGNIVKIILDSSMKTELSSDCESSAPLTLHDIYDRIKSSDVMNTFNTTKAIDITTLRGVIEFLRCDALGIVDKIPSNDDGNPAYFVRMKSIISYAKRKLIHDIATSRYDVQSGRIIELLQGEKKYYEEQELSDHVILPARDTRERLYRMFRDKWVDYYELSKRSDFNPGSTYYYWYLDNARLRQSILNNMYKSVFNLRLRKLIESGKIESVRGIGTQSSTGTSKSNNGNQSSSASLMISGRTMNRLEAGLINITQTINLMSKF